MEMEKPARYIVYGAGAIGGAFGGMMASAGLRVVCVARAPQAYALRSGVLIRENDERFEVKANSVTSAREIDPERGDLIIITTKSQATAQAVEELSAVYDRSVPVVCLQNGIRNEKFALLKFDNVYAGLLMWSAIQLAPDEIMLSYGRDMAIGCFPNGVDWFAEQCSQDMERAGFDVMASAHVMAMKWGKLVANLNNATNAITGYWLERGMADPDMRLLMLKVREEGLRVLEAAGIEVEPPEGEPSPIRILEMTEKLRRPPKPSGDAEELPPERRSYASMWQDIYLGRKSSEIDFLNGEIVELGAGYGIPTPYNSALMEVVSRMVAEGLKPGIHTPAELHDIVRTRADRI